MWIGPSAALVLERQGVARKTVARPCLGITSAQRRATSRSTIVFPAFARRSARPRQIAVTRTGLRVVFAGGIGNDVTSVQITHLARTLFVGPASVTNTPNLSVRVDQLAIHTLIRSGCDTIRNVLGISDQGAVAT